MKNLNELLEELYYSLDDVHVPKSGALYKKMALFEELTKLLDEDGKKMFIDYGSAEGICRSDACMSHFKRGFYMGFRHVFELLLNE